MVFFFSFFEFQFLFLIALFDYVLVLISMLNNPPDNWHFTVDPPPPPKKKGCFLGRGSEFWDKIVNFGFYDIKKFLAQIWDKPNLPATFRPIFGHFRPICAFWNPKIFKNGNFYVIFRTFYVQNSILV